MLIPVILSVVYKSNFSLKHVEPKTIAHDIFVKIYFKLNKYNPEKPVLPWIQTIVKNNLIDLYRKQKSNNNKTQSLDQMVENNYNLFEVIARSERNPEELMIESEIKEELNDMLGMLKPMDKELVEGFYLQEKSLKELALEINSSVNAVSIRLFRAKNQLRKALPKHMSYFFENG